MRFCTIYTANAARRDYPMDWLHFLASLYCLATTGRRQLSSIIRAPSRKVMGVPGQRRQAAR